MKNYVQIDNDDCAVKIYQIHHIESSLIIIWINDSDDVPEDFDYTLLNNSKKALYQKLFTDEIKNDLIKYNFSSAPVKLKWKSKFIRAKDVQIQNFYSLMHPDRAKLFVQIVEQFIDNFIEYTAIHSEG